MPLPYTAFNSLQPIALGGNQPNAVAFLGKDAVGLAAVAGRRLGIAELDSYETPIKDGHLNDVVLGDLNNDGRKDLVFMETAKNYLDLVTFDANHKLVPATRWQVFEERTFPQPAQRPAGTARSAGYGRDRRRQERPGRAGARPDPGLSAAVTSGATWSSLKKA